MNLNREQRRAAKRTHAVLVRKTKRQRHHVDPRAGLRALDRARPFDAGDTTDQHILTRCAMERLIDGTLDAVFAKSESALVAVRKRHQRLGKFGFTVLELEATNDALEAQEAIVDASSPQQIHDAVMTVAKLMGVQIQSSIRRGKL